MQTIGERLEEARKRKGISIREAAETTKIRGDYLQKFEANSFDIDLPPLYLRGFIRTYAKFLELDAERLVGDLDAALARDGKPQRREHREALGRVDFGGGENRSAESSEPAAGNSRSARDQAMLVKLGILGGGALILVIAIILLINVLFFRNAPKPSPQPTAPVATQPSAPTENVLTLIAKGPVRVKVMRVSNNQVLLDGLSALATGETKMVRYTDKLKVTVDDPSKLAMELNGRRAELPIQQYGFFFIEP